MMNELKPLIEAIEENNSFFLVSHIDPDGDAIGSLIAMLLLLKQKGKRVVAYDRDGVPEIYRFLKYSDEIVSSPPPGAFDIAIFLECPTVERAGAECAELINEIPLWVNLDHHEDNAGFGRVNIKMPELSAVGEMIYDLYLAMDAQMDIAVAEALYTAIMTDTGSYRFSNTSPKTHEISSRLLEMGIKPDVVYRAVFEQLSTPAALIAARAHGTLDIENSIACITITRAMLEETGATAEDTHDIVGFGRPIKDVEVALLFRETENDIKVSLRSKTSVDVNRIAAGFGGGGHLRAAGCNIKGTMEDVKTKVIAAVREALSISSAGSSPTKGR